MKFGVPWSVKGIRPEARETAREAARRSGMSLGDWLNSVIIQQAEHEGVHAHADDDDITATSSPMCNERLDHLTRRIEQMMRTGPAAYAPRRIRNESDQVADLIGRLDHRLDQFAGAARMAPPIAPPVMPPFAPPMQLPPASTAPSPKSPRASAPSKASRRSAAPQAPPIAADAAAHADAAGDGGSACRCRRRTCRGWRNSFAISPTRSRRCASPASRRRSTRYATNSPRSAMRSPKPCRGAPSTPSKSKFRA